MTHRVDLISLILVQWPFSELLTWMRLMTTVMNRKENCKWDEFIFSDSTEIECGGQETMSFRCYCNEVYRNASSVSRDAVMDEKMYYTHAMRGCFLIAFLYDLRVQRFVMTDHFLHFQLLLSQPPARDKANHFMDSVRPMIDAFLDKTLSLNDATHQCVACWIDQMFHRHPISCSMIDELGF
jgi:hypothetical protein